MMLRGFLRSILPSWSRKLLRDLQSKTFGEEMGYAGKSEAEIFDSIYRNGIWNEAGIRQPTSGKGSHDEKIIIPYIKEISQLLLDIKPDTILDIGCGDFNVGRNFAQFAREVIACDISNEILEINKKKFVKLRNVNFRRLDLAKDQLPRADVAFVRQVLQHLSNTSIQAFVESVNLNKPFRYLVLTEHLPASTSFEPNIDKPSGPNIRAWKGSGILLDEHPFNLKARSRRVLLEIPEPAGDVSAVIQTVLYEL